MSLKELKYGRLVFVHDNKIKVWSRTNNRVIREVPLQASSILERVATYVVGMSNDIKKHYSLEILNNEYHVFDHTSGVVYIYDECLSFIGLYENKIKISTRPIAADKYFVENNKIYGYITHPILAGKVQITPKQIIEIPPNTKKIEKHDNKWIFLCSGPAQNYKNTIYNADDFYYKDGEIYLIIAVEGYLKTIVMHRLVTVFKDMLFVDDDFYCYVDEEPIDAIALRDKCIALLSSDGEITIIKIYPATHYINFLKDLYFEFE